MKNPFTEHPNDTKSPEGYWVHFFRAFKNGFLFIWVGITAIIHAIFPWWFKFYSAEKIIEVYWKICHADGRHDELIDKWKPKNIKITEYPTRYDRPIIEMYQCEPAEVESHPSHNWKPGNKGPRDT